jgi:outer membrane protein assembly factor BamB
MQYREQGGAVMTYVRLSTGQRLWTVDLGTSSWWNQRVGNVMVVGDYNTGVVRGYDRRTGRELWTHTLPNARWASAGKDRVCLWAGGTLQALNPATGVVAWETTAPASLQYVVSEQHLLIGCTTDGAVIALRAADGARAWEQKAGGANNYVRSVGGRLIVYPTSQPGRVSCLNPQTGARLWDADLPHRVSWTFDSKDRLYLTDYDRTITCVDPATGRRLWDFSGASIVPSTERDGRLVVRDGQNRRLSCLDARNGSTLWAAGFDGDRNAYPVVTREQVLLVDYSTKTLTAFDGATGARQWELRGDGQHVYPYLRDKWAYVIKSDREVVRLDVKTGREQWRYSARDRVIGLTLIEGRILVGTRSGIAAVSASDGRGAWHLDTEGPFSSFWSPFTD